MIIDFLRENADFILIALSLGISGIFGVTISPDIFAKMGAKALMKNDQTFLENVAKKIGYAISKAGNKISPSDWDKKIEPQVVNLLKWFINRVTYHMKKHKL